MRKNNFISIFILFSVIYLFSCNKKEIQSTVGNTPIKEAIDTKTPADTIYSQSNPSANFGFRFHATKNGKITRLGCRMPEIGTYEVTLWDFNTKNLLANKSISITASDDFFYSLITSVAIVATKDYVISVNNSSSAISKKYFQLFKKPTPATNLYPFTVKDIVIMEPLYKSGATSACPDYNNSSDFPYLRGLSDFEFIAD